MLSQHSDRVGRTFHTGRGPSPCRSLTPSPTARNSPTPEAWGAHCPTPDPAQGLGMETCLQRHLGTAGSMGLCLWHIPSSNSQWASYLLPPPFFTRPWKAGLEPPCQSPTSPRAARHPLQPVPTHNHDHMHIQEQEHSTAKNV